MSTCMPRGERPQAYHIPFNPPLRNRSLLNFFSFCPYSTTPLSTLLASWSPIILASTAFRANQQASKLNKTKSAAPGRGKPRQSNVTVQETGDEHDEEDEEDDGGLADQSAMMEED